MGFGSLEIGRRALQTSQVALDVTGHNIANANTEGYSRQMVNINAVTNLDSKYGEVGVGVDLESIKRARNTFLDDRMIKENSEKSKWEVMQSNLEHIQTVINEPSDKSIRTILDQFWSSLQDLSSNPEDRAVRVTVKERASDLANSLQGTYEQLKALQSDVNDNIKLKVDSINSSIKQLADINSQITRLEANRKEANDLKDRRDKLVEDLSKLVNVQVTRNDQDFSLVIGGKTAVQGTYYAELKVMPNREINNGSYEVKWADTDSLVYINNGELKGLLDIRDRDINTYLDYMDQLAVGIIDRVNETHSMGYDLNGQIGSDFFGAFDVKSETMDIDNDGANEAAVYRVKGTNPISSISQVLGTANGTGNTFNIPASNRPPTSSGMEIKIGTTVYTGTQIVTSPASPGAGQIQYNPTTGNITFPANPGTTAVGTGNGAATTFNIPAANRPPSTAGLEIKVGSTTYSGSQIVTSPTVPASNQVQYDPATGNITFGTVPANGTAISSKYLADADVNYKFAYDASKTKLENFPNLETAIGLTLPDKTGEFEVNGIKIGFDLANDSLQDIINKVNDANVGVVASLDPYNRLAFRADKDAGYVLKSFEDTDGHFLRAMGILNAGETKFDYKNTGDLSKISTLDRMAPPKDGAASRIYVKINNVDQIAAAKGKDTNGDRIPDTTNGPGDGANAIDIGSLRYQPSIGKYTYANYFASLISEVGVDSQQATRYVESQDILITNLEQRRQSETGVSLDEEMTNMIKYQQSYNAASKFISVVNQMLDTLMNKL